MAILKIYDGSVWQTPVPKIYNGSSWITPSTLQFHDGSSWVILYTSLAASISDWGISDSSAFNGYLDAIYKLSSDGNVYNHNNTLLESWLDSGTASQFDVRVTATGDPLYSGTLNTWQNLSVDRAWHLKSTGDAQTNLSVSIRDASSLTILDTASITLQTIGSGPVSVEGATVTL